MNYYNEFDPQAAQWLRNLIAAGLIPAGDVDERSIEDVIPNELRGYTQCHFFAGIAGWSLALDLAGWPRDRPVWTGSCPCQPFSAAGKGAGFADERHLWPAWQHLIAQRKPATVFGEQVASKAVDDWIDLVHADMEGLGYAFGSVSFPSAGVGAPHRRDRAYWVAHTEIMRRQGQHLHAGGRLPPFGVEDCGWADPDRLACRDGKWRPVEPGTFPLAHGIPGRVGRLRAYGNSIVPQAAAAFVGAYMAGEMAQEMAA